MERMKMKPYIHKVNYYETDKMGITHHSNYVRFMEEARVDFLDQLGWSFDKLEAKGVVSPVLSLESVLYKSPFRGLCAVSDSGLMEHVTASPG